MRKLLEASLAKIRLASVFSLFLIVICSSTAQAAVQPPIAPGASLDGTFTVDLGGSVGWLEERPAEGTWKAISGSFGRDEVAITGRSNGVYYYRIGQLGANWSTSYSHSISVVVGAAPPEQDNSHEQSQYTFEARIGDLNNDGLMDLFIARLTGGDKNNGVIYKTLLLQEATSQLVPLASPSELQLSRASQWPLLNAQITLEDINIDGYVDLIVNVFEPDNSSMLDQLVFSSGVLFDGNAKAATAIDKELGMYLDDMYGWAADRNYFDAAVQIAQEALRVSVLEYVSGYFQWCSSYFCSWIQVSGNIGVIYQRVFTATQLSQALQKGLSLHGSGDGDNLSGFVGDWYLGGDCLYLYSSALCYQWVESNRIVEVGGGFDEENYSKAAKETADAFEEISQIPLDQINQTQAANVTEKFARQINQEVPLGSDEYCETAPVANNFVIAIPAAVPVAITCGRIIYKVAKIVIKLKAVEEAIDYEFQETIFRVFGNKSPIDGQSWTPVNPIIVPNFRDAAGLPRGNSCEKMVIGILKSRLGMEVRPALEWEEERYNYYVKGGLTEYYFEDRSRTDQLTGQIKYTSVWPMVPPC